MLKLSSKIHLVPTLNGLYVNTNGTLLLVLSLWLVGVDVRCWCECVCMTFKNLQHVAIMNCCIKSCPV